MTLQEAVDAVPADNASPFVIRIAPGTRREKVRVDKPFVHFIGEDAATTRLVWGDGALTVRSGAAPGTFESYTLLVTGDDFYAEGLTIENDAGAGPVAGQAVAASVEGDRAVFRRCRLLGHQDTLFTGPLPPFPLTAASFGTPREHLPRRPLRQFYEDCFLRGDVDFIFGSAAAVFLRCELFSNGRGGEPGWITAASTPEGQEYGYVFLECTLTSDATAATVYLGRPWRDFARTVFWNCRMGAHIRPEGWHDWDKPAARLTSFYAEGGSTGPGASGERVEWSHRLTGSAPTVAEILGGEDGWNPK